jgi:hypothetical protein
MQTPRLKTEAFLLKLKEAEKDCEMRIKPGMSLPQLKTEYDRARIAVHKCWDIMHDDEDLPEEQQSEDYHNCVKKIRTAAKIHSKAERGVYSMIEKLLQISGVEPSIVISIMHMLYDSYVD